MSIEKIVEECVENFGTFYRTEGVARRAARRARKAALQEAADIACAIDSGRGNEKEIVKAIREAVGKMQ